MVSLAVLSDPEKKDHYDRFGEVGEEEEDFGEYFQEHFADILTDIFNFKIPKAKKKGKRKKGPIGKEAKNKYGNLTQLFAQMMDLGNMDEDDEEAWERHVRKSGGKEEEWEDLEEWEDDEKESYGKKETGGDDEWEDI